MSHELREGVLLASVIGPEIDGEYLHFVVREGGVSRIVVSEQAGQMGMVPWARVEFFDDQDKPPVLVNLAHIESVQLLPEES